MSSLPITANPAPSLSSINERAVPIIAPKQKVASLTAAFARIQKEAFANRKEDDGFQTPKSHKKFLVRQNSNNNALSTAASSPITAASATPKISPRKVPPVSLSFKQPIANQSAAMLNNALPKLKTDYRDALIRKKSEVDEKTAAASSFTFSEEAFLKEDSYSTSAASAASHRPSTAPTKNSILPTDITRAIRAGSYDSSRSSSTSSSTCSSTAASTPSHSPSPSLRASPIISPIASSPLTIDTAVAIEGVTSPASVASTPTATPRSGKKPSAARSQSETTYQFKKVQEANQKGKELEIHYLTPSQAKKIRFSQSNVSAITTDREYTIEQTYATFYYYQHEEIKPIRVSITPDGDWISFDNRRLFAYRCLIRDYPTYTDLLIRATFHKSMNMQSKVAERINGQFSPSKKQNGFQFGEVSLNEDGVFTLSGDLMTMNWKNSYVPPKWNKK